MKKTTLRRVVLIQLLVFINLLGAGGCTSGKQTENREKLTIGVVSYGEGAVSLQRYERFKDYMATQTGAVVELEPAYNELQAIEQIQRKKWDIVFAPPGLAAIAISKAMYAPLFSLEGLSNRQRSLLIVRENDPIKKISDLANKTVALGEIGSAAGYYVPLYDLYGLTLAQIRFASTPKTVLQWISDKSVDAGAMSENDFNLYHQSFPQAKFRVLHTSRWIPIGLVLVGQTVDRNRQAEIEKAMKDAPGDIVADAGYVPTAKAPNYNQFIEIVEKVRPLENQSKQKPAVLLIRKSAVTDTTTGTQNDNSGSRTQQ
ncbi:phosphate/phosphite/phosphonate ABC transporter substrate-binding protein [Aetokthonos hydrillicola Thurmond2011]|uniref:Phosphate/phosphite/phosphonate ABC transporter substrate-binding protein n=1 Tax=Aetokthonos hydrillicola Thurmond2011 TaxID=2712845 RepID=A0AAP5I4D0_9CYAN|nr:PhnD/SsuA/transferrin family substrate-binding protein [Aetokthonos hydrillicola]MBO3460833.1 phosphate/phosphite/phosphonate ABC transporter substrate-binding protein [Aetokthonos hydrillicola CCALA 1050]MBW4585626.1 phosphate/phosphite/phosphonate ABC transporter substrate-binding protein [Aetokthonos hydrillicola CCALA 1050]MDR9894526.1 phosphate/phosphite/phosphonate ABC transporter substrate-binding protein [Aetokthonos hydrillicola Thurmond2011]